MTTNLNKQRKRLHLLTFCTQLLVGFNTLVLYNLVKSGQLKIPMMVLLVFHLAILVWLHIIVLRTCAMYFKSNIRKVLYGVLIFSGFTINLFATAPPMEHSPLGIALRIISTLMMLAGQLIWFVFIVRDIFIEQHDLSYRILGAANIYWLSVVIFAYIYVLIEIFFPGSIGVSGISSADMVGNMYKLSLHATVSIDHTYTGIRLYMENLLLMQSALSHLFIVFLVGRLLTK